MADLTGKTLGKYRLVERLGRGGMAEVYKAYQPALDRYVAVKLMHGYLAEDEGFVGRFQREAKAIAALHHPNIVQVHDFDIEQDVYYMVQEYIEGGTLKARLKRANEQGRPVPIEETVRVLKAVCGAVDYAHQQGRIHRDIKPDNIMFDARNRPVLTDFGIAAIVGGTRFTATGAMVGTPAYMSPEQGKGEPGDERSDVYSLGVVLYEMITGRIPFDADTPFAVVLKHLNDPLPLPRTLNPDVPFGVERVILKALAKDPEDRYQTAGDLARTLEEAVREAVEPEWEMPAPLEAPSAVGVTPAVEVAPTAETPLPAKALPVAEVEPVVAPLATPVKLAGKKKVWLWVVIAVAGVLLLACCVCVGIRVVNQNRPSVVPTATAGGDATPMGDETPASGIAALIQAGNEELGEECDGDIDRALALFEQALEQDADSVAALIGRARCRACNGEHETAMQDLDRAVELAPDSAAPVFWRGLLWMVQENGEEALANLTRAIELEPEFKEAYYARGQLSMWLIEDDALALSDMNRVIELDPNFAEAYLYRGRLSWWHLGDPGAALADFDRFVELQPDSPDGYADRGEVYLEALIDYERAVSEYTQAIDRDPNSAFLYARRAWAHYHLEAFDLAIEDYTRVLDIEPDVEAQFRRGMMRYYAGQYEAALEDLDMVLLIGGDREGAAHHAKGWVYSAMGHYAEAIEAYNQAAQYDWDQYSWPFFDESHWLLERGIAYRENKQFDQALNDLNAFVKDWEWWFRGYYERGLTYKAMGDTKLAADDLRTALEFAEDEEWRNRITEEIRALEAGGQ